jgi:hypothetical protein
MELRGTREMGKVGNIYWMDSCRDQAGIVEHNGALWWKQDEGVYWSSSLSWSQQRRSQMKGGGGDVDDDEDDGTMVVAAKDSLSLRADASSSLSDSDSATSSN